MREIALLHLLLTGACNLRCNYCYQDRSPRSMGWETLQRSLDWACRVTRPGLKIAFSGGEPMLEFPLIRRGVAYAERRRDPALPIQYILLTNGLLLDGETTRFLVDHDFDLQISFDGVTQAQDLRAPESFETLDRLLTRLQKEHPGFYERHVTVAATVVPEAIDHLAESVAYLLSKEVPEVALAPGMGTGGDWAPDRIADMEEQFERIIQLSVERHRRNGEIPFPPFRGGSSCASPGEVGESICGVVHAKTPAVDTDGQVYGCALLVEPMLTGESTWFRRELERLRIGCLSDPDFEQQFAVWCQGACESGLLTCRGEKRSSYGRCSECVHVHDCSLCPISIGLAPGNRDPHRVPDFDCAFMQVALRARERFRRNSGAGVDRLARFLGLSELPPAVRRLQTVARAVKGAPVSNSESTLASKLERDGSL